MEDAPKYSSLIGAPKYVFTHVMFQDFKTDNFKPSTLTPARNSQTTILAILLAVSSTWMTILLLNMLVAIMANRQNIEQKEATRTKLRHQLSLIVDFWPYNPFK